MLRFQNEAIFSRIKNVFFQNFSTISKRNFVPKLLKDPKFTRQGIAKKKKKNLTYDLSKPYIVNPHLYYDEKNDKISKRKELKARKSIRNEYPPITQEFSSDHLINNLNDEYLLNKPSGRILSAIIELEKRDKELINEHSDLVKSALNRVSQKVFFFNLREFGILVSLASRYLPRNNEIWKNCSLNFLRILEKKRYYKEEGILNTKSKENNFIFLYNNICKACKNNKLEENSEKISQIIKEILLKDIENIQNVSHIILFFTTLANNAFSKKEEGKEFIQNLITKLKGKMEEINAKDALSLIHTMKKFSILDYETLKTLETKVLEVFKKETNPNQNLIHHFSMLSQDVTYIPQYSPLSFPDFAPKYFLQHQNLINSVKDLCFLLDSFTKMKVPSREIYKNFEKKLNHLIKDLPFESCQHLLISAQRRYENFSLIFLSYLAMRLDKLYQMEENFKKFNSNFAVKTINLMNLVREKDRAVSFEAYDNLIGVIEAGNLKNNILFALILFTLTAGKIKRNSHLKSRDLKKCWPESSYLRAESCISKNCHGDDFVGCVESCCTCSPGCMSNWCQEQMSGGTRIGLYGCVEACCSWEK